MTCSIIALHVTSSGCTRSDRARFLKCYASSVLNGSSRPTSSNASAGCQFDPTALEMTGADVILSIPRRV